MNTLDHFLKKRNRTESKDIPNNLSEKVNKNHIADSYIIEWKNGIKFNLRRDDLTSQETNAIVNAANNDLWMGGGVAGAIRRKGGPKIQAECSKLVNQRGQNVENGEVVHTGIGDFSNTNLKYIFHAVGPVYYNGKRDEDIELKRAFSNCFKLSDKLKIESISIPPISSGIFGYPKEECAEIFYDCLEIYVNSKLKSGSSICLKDIRMTIIDEETYSIFVKVHKTKIMRYKEIMSANILQLIPDDNKEDHQVEESNLEKKYLGENEKENFKENIDIYIDGECGEINNNHESKEENKNIYSQDTISVNNDSKLKNENKNNQNNESINLISSVEDEDQRMELPVKNSNSQISSNEFYIELKEEPSECILKQASQDDFENNSKNQNLENMRNIDIHKLIPSSFDITSSQMDGINIIDEKFSLDKDQEKDIN